MAKNRFHDKPAIPTGAFAAAARMLLDGARAEAGAVANLGQQVGGAFLRNRQEARQDDILGENRRIRAAEFDRRETRLEGEADLRAEERAERFNLAERQEDRLGKGLELERDKFDEIRAREDSLKQGIDGAFKNIAAIRSRISMGDPSGMPALHALGTTPAGKLAMRMWEDMLSEQKQGGKTTSSELDLAGDQAAALARIAKDPQQKIELAMISAHSKSEAQRQGALEDVERERAEDEAIVEKELIRRQEAEAGIRRQLEAEKIAPDRIDASLDLWRKNLEIGDNQALLNARSGLVRTDREQRDEEARQAELRQRGANIIEGWQIAAETLNFPRDEAGNPSRPEDPKGAEAFDRVARAMYAARSNPKFSMDQFRRDVRDMAEELKLTPEAKNKADSTQSDMMEDAIRSSVKGLEDLQKSVEQANKETISSGGTIDLRNLPKATATQKSEKAEEVWQDWKAKWAHRTTKEQQNKAAAEIGRKFGL